jgi:hypothetical protein
MDKIDDEVNTQFIKAVINHTQQNEEVSLVSLDNGVLVLTFDAASLKLQQQQRGDKRCQFYCVSDNRLCQDLLVKPPQTI